MCLLIIAEEQFPDYSLLQEAQLDNPSGIGIAYRWGGKVFYEKGITLERLMEFKTFKPPFLIHFRLATVGAASPALCHPFPLDRSVFHDRTKGSADSVLAHNGHWGDYTENAKLLDINLKANWSDTKVMAVITKRIGPDWLAKYPSQKVAIMNEEKIWRIGDGWVQKPDGLWLSHEMWGNLGMYGYYEDDSYYTKAFKAYQGNKYRDQVMYGGD